MSISKIALVTGGSRGLGKDMALALAARGVDVILTYRSREAEAKVVVGAIQAMGRRAACLQLDVSNASSFTAFATSVSQTLQSTFGQEQLHYLVNNAGEGVHTPFMSTTEEQFDSMVNIHLKGVYFLTQRLLPLVADGGGIVNISSGLARFSFDGYSAYATMKGGVETLTKYLAKELGARKMRVNVVAPGAIATDFGGGAVRDNEQLNGMLASMTALGRVGQASDIGGVVAFLCSDDARWVNGQRLEVSGGIML